MSVSKLFLFGGIIIALFGLVLQLIMPDSALDIHLHDTYFVIAHLHIILSVAFIFLLFSGVYAVFPKLFKRKMNRTAGLIHFSITALCTILIFWPMHYEGIAGMPGRYYNNSAWEQFRSFSNLNWFVSVAVVLGFLSQLIFGFNFVISIFTGKKVNSQII